MTATPASATSAPAMRAPRSGSLGIMKCANTIPKIGIVAWRTAERPEET